MIQFLDFSFNRPDENLALEEVLVTPFVRKASAPLIRVWQNEKTVVVLGRGEKTESQVHTQIAETLNIPILRRISGGGTVVHAPGNINLSFFLPYDFHADLHSIRKSYAYILERVAQALKASMGCTVDLSGSSDLSIAGKKISGTAQARKRFGLLHHMTLMVDMDSTIIVKLLKEPDRQPDYRQSRSHLEFVTSLKSQGYTWDRNAFIQELGHQFVEIQPIELDDEHREQTLQLAQKKYRSPDWNLHGRIK